MASSAKAPLVKLTPDLNKIVEAILLVLQTAREKGKTVTQYDIVKTFFLADRRHLNEFGRPITFDNYVAMKHGPVPSQAYDLLKGGSYAKQLVGGDLPWKSEPIAGSPARKFTGTVDHDPEVFAPSEVEALLESFTVVTSLGFGQIKRLTHEDAAYLDAWEGGPEGNGSYPMSLGLLFDNPNMDLAADLEFVSQFGSN